MKRILLTFFAVMIIASCSHTELVEIPLTKTDTTTYINVADSVEMSGVPIDFNVKIEDWE